MLSPGESGGTPKQKQEAVAHIEECRKRLQPRLSQREAAERAGISRQYWEEIVAGQKRRHGVTRPVVPSIQILMSMASVVGAEHRVAQILGMIPPDVPEPRTRLTVELRSTGELRLVQAMLDLLRSENVAGHAFEGLRAG